MKNEEVSSNTEGMEPASIKDRSHHGTMVAMLAGGKTAGMAPKAGLYLYKACADVMVDGKIQPVTTLLSWKATFHQVLSKIKYNKRKAVVNLSFGKQRPFHCFIIASGL